MRLMQKGKGKGKRRGKERGQSLVEVAIILPVLLIILAGVLDLGRMYFSYVAITDAAGEGAAYAAIDPEEERGSIYQRAQEATHGLVQIEESNVQVDFPEGKGTGAPAVVPVTYAFQLAPPFMGVIVPEGRITLTAVASESILYGDF